MKNNSVKWLYNVIGKQKLQIVLLIAVQSLNGGWGVLYALIMRSLVDSAAAKKKEDFVMYAAFMLGMVAASVILKAAIKFLDENTRSSIENLLKQRLLDKLLHKDYSTVSAVHSGEWLNRLTSDSVVIASNSVDILPGLAGMLVKMISAAVMMIVLDKRFAFIVLPAGIVLFFTTYAFRKILKKLHKNVQETDGKLRIFLQERLGSLMMIRSFAAEEQTQSDAAEKMQIHKNARMKRNRFSNICNSGFTAGMQGMYAAGAIYCAYGILQGSITYGTLTAITQLISQIQSPFANITGYLPKFYAMTASAERIMEIEKFADDCESEIKTIDEILDEYESSFASFGLKNAEFTYYPAVDSIQKLSKENMPVVLKNISLEIKKGQFTAFTGHSGCGKSTVLKLLMCIYKLDGGMRFIHSSDGSENELLPVYHRLFAYVPQGNQLMSGTVRDVVSFADPGASDDEERLFEALRIACADEFIGELENGIDTLLGERGTGLSEGQMQRIAVARAIFSESPVLLLDESTSALDEATEKKMLENLKNMTDKTVVIVTHRPAALQICDSILEFTEEGVVQKK